MWVDSHCHLNFDVFNEDRDTVVQRAHDAGVGTMLTICTKMNQVQDVIAIAERYPSVYASVGVHPHEARDDQSITAEQLIELSKHPRVVAIGETGLDYFYSRAHRDTQISHFRLHIEATQKTGLPLIVHTRDADYDTIGIMREEAERGGRYPAVIHCFTAGPEVAQMALDLGLMISLSGIITFKKSEKLREIIRPLPLESLLVETDAPYLAPDPRRGKRNEPAFVVHTAERLAEILGVTKSELATATTDNFFRTFNKVPRPVAQR